MVSSTSDNMPVVASAKVDGSGVVPGHVALDIKYTKLFINNEWVAAKSGKQFETVNPINGQVICKVEEAGAEDVDIAVKAARQAYKSVWSKTGPSARSALLLKLADLIERDIDELAALESLDNGKTFGIAKVIDTSSLAATMRYWAGFAHGKISGRTIEADGPYEIRTVVEPMGVVGAVIPWNFPLLMFAWKLGPAMAAGNTLVVKTSEKTPLSAFKLAALIKEAGFPPGVVNVLSGYGMPAGNALASHMDVDKVAFTGSTATGRKIMSAAANSNLKKVSLELGGKSPSIVFPDVNIDAAVEGTHFGMFFNAGQTCCAGTRTFVHESIYDEFVKKATARAKLLKLSAEQNTPFSQGPQIDKIQYDKIMQYIETGKKEGAKLQIGGMAGPSGYYISPTIFSDVQDHHTIAKEEIFGPVMSILKWSTIDEVIDRANNTPYGLAASVFCNDITVCNYVSSQLKAGTVWVNCHNILQPQAPFGGYKQSGFGRDNGEYSIIEYSQIKCITTKRAEGVPALPTRGGSSKVLPEQAESKQGEVAAH